MNILFLGDVSGNCGRGVVFKYLYDLKEKYSVDFCIANAENSAGGFGATHSTLDELSRAGVDAFTMGNHTYSKKEIVDILDSNDFDIVRPFNFPKTDPGRGCMICRTKQGGKIAVINAIGRLYMSIPSSNPFEEIKPLLEDVRSNTNNIIIDFHAEATSEKKAFAYFVDGMASAVIGTHTHTQTADEMILPNGCGFISDAGMCGARQSVLGADISVGISKFTTSVPAKFEISDKEPMLNAVFIELDENGKTVRIERININ
ncbi:MAG: TIGR00282 family metallophosphoesterase [Clostridia bacterium]|nr:TIGR00282 family metallophosphoesterase [Clostridia bacterium]